MKASWRRILANGLLALALVLSHAVMPVAPVVNASPVQAPVHHHAMAMNMDAGHCHDSQPDQKTVPANPCGKACPGMALFLPEPSAFPVRLSFDAYPPVPSQHAKGTSPSLDTPPPRPVAPV